MTGTENKSSDPLLAIAPAAEVVAGVTVTGIPLRGCVELMRRFAALADLFAGKTIDAEALYAVAPDAVAAVLAAGVGRAGDAAAEKLLDELPLGTQTQLLDALIRATFPEGLANFRDRLVRLASVLSAGDPGEAAGQNPG